MAQYPQNYSQSMYQPSFFTNTQNILVSTKDDMPGYDILEYIGIVFGITVRTRGVGGQTIANCQACIGGEVTAFTTMSAEARNDAYQRMVIEAAARGANAIIGVRFGSSAGGRTQSMMDIVAYGTAIRVQPKMR